MVEMNNSCDSCVHKNVCKYTETFKKSKNNIVKVTNNQFEAYDFNGFVDLSIRCRHYIMAPYREVPSKQNRKPLEFYFNDIHKADIEKTQKHNWEFPKPDFMKTSIDMQEDK